jgi:hypothetical protein
MTGRQVVSRTAGGVEAAFEWVAGMPVRARRAIRDLREAREEVAAKAAAPTIEERREDLLSFYVQYERLVEIVCDGAQYGPEPKLQTGYSELRAWMQANYPRLRRYVTAYLQYDSEDARQGLNLHGSACDAFEALYAAPTLDEFLRGDDGMMISRIMRTRDALNLYGDHLRHLKARE